VLVGDPKLGGISSTICAYEALKVEQWGVQGSESLGAWENIFFLESEQAFECICLECKNAAN